ncbi:unnamed protein product [Rotaria sp. Silwood2]|nr:unnamed protein product [Rotaria sp. Silwood2]
MPIEVGQQAPDFTLYNTEQKEISLKDLRSKSNVVLLFFPLAFTSVFDSLFSLGKFRQENEIPFDLLSDFNKEISRKYDSLYEDFPLLALKGVTKRSAFIIDKQGIIRYAEILVDPTKLPDFDKIKEILDNFNKS